MTLPSLKVVAAASGGIIAGSYLGPKLGAKLAGPELDKSATFDQIVNAAKIYGSSLAVGLATFTVLYVVFRA